MWGALPSIAEGTVAAVVADVPSYARAFSGRMGAIIEAAVQQALAGFLRLTAEGADPDMSGTVMPAAKPAFDGAFTLGQGEARQGRSTDVLLAAYRVGARTAWREFSAIAVSHGIAASDIGVFAELIFAYIDQLSARSVAGHADELAKTGLARQRQREQLARQLLAGAPLDDIRATAERAAWPPPRTLTAIAVPRDQVLAALDPRTLEVPEDALGPLPRHVTVLLVPDVGGAARSAFVESIAADGVVVGPGRPWAGVAASVRRVLRALQLGLETPVDTDERLVELVARADEEALADLRERVLDPMRDLRPGARDKLVETLRAWVLYQGRRDDIAAALFVHPQTVRYRLGQLREIYGDRLQEPDRILEFAVALAVD